MAIRAKLFAGLVERQQDGMERCARYLERVKPGGPEFEDTRRRLKALRSMLAERRSPVELFELARLDVAVDLSAPELLQSVLPPEGAPLRLVEFEAFGWLAVHIETEPLQIIIRERLEIWGHLAGYEVSDRPMGRSVLVPVDGGKADWWAWAAQQAERLLVPC